MEKIMAMIPTYNEKENIERLIKEILSLELNIEIVVVDDHSPDGTSEVVSRLKGLYPQVHLITRYKERGRGLAGIVGFKYCLSQGASCIIEMDADFSHHPKHIPEFLEGIKKGDLVLGSRFVEGGQDLERGWLRHLITLIANPYVRFILGIKIKDATSGYRCYRREVLEALDLDRMVSKGPPIVQEMLYKCLLKGFKVIEVPIIFRDRKQGESSFNLKVFFDAFVMVPRLKWMFMRGKI